MEEEFINFLKKHNLYKEEIFEFIKPRTFYIDNLDDYSMSFVGCYPKVEKNINSYITGNNSSYLLK